MRRLIAGIRCLPVGAFRRLLLFLPWLWVTATAFCLDPSRPLALHAQRTWRSEDGLLQDTASALLESKDGYLWVGTDAGLVRYDGATFEPFSRATVPGFLHNGIQALVEDSRGALWIATSEPGLYLFQRGSVRTFGPAEGLPDRPIRRLLKDSSETLWAAPTEGPLLRFDGKRFQPVPSDAAHLRISALAEDRVGSLWVGTVGSGLWRLRQGRLTLAALAATEITALAAGTDGEIWVGTRSRGLLAWVDGRLEAPGWSRKLPHHPISALLQDRAGSLWVGIEQDGLFRCTPGGHLEAAPGAAGARWTPLSLLEDRSGALWSGSEDRGLRVIYPVPFQTVPVAGDPSEASVLRVCQDSAGTLWCVTGDHALGTLRQGRIERLPAPSLGPIAAIWPRRAGGLWLGVQGGGVFVLDQGKVRQIRSTAGSPSDAILGLYEDPEQVLWIATLHQGLVRLAPDGSQTRYPAILDIQSMAGGGQGPLYLGSPSRGLGILEAGQVRWLGPADGLGSIGVRALCLDPGGTLWLGTLDGLRCYRNGTIQTARDRSDPWALTIHTLLVDTDHHLWISTSQGLFRVPLADLAMAIQGTRLASAAALFDHHDGMPSRETSVSGQPAAWLSREGDLYFATSRGLTWMASGAQPTPGPPLQLHILKAESDETILPDILPIQVPPGTHRFEVYYTATSLTRVDKVRFRYRLEGWDHIWNEVGDRRFSAYANLPPGSYRFVVQAWRVGEQEPPQERSIEVRVLPFLHQRPLFWVLCLMGAAGFGWWMLRLRFQQVEARSAVLAERNRMAREIHDHLAQGFTGVLLQLEAAEAKLSRMQGDPEPVLTRLDHARNLAVASLQEARRSVMTLSPRKPAGTDLLGALRLLADRLLAGTDIQVDLLQTGVPRPLRNRLEEELLRMAQEMLTNALRHGKARWVRVILQFQGRQVHLCVEDDGQGFDPAASAAGYGMRSIRDSLKQLGGHLDIDSSPGFGSRITITLPLRRWRP